MDIWKKKRILIVHNFYQLPGGEDSVVTNEKKMLESYGHVVVLYSRNNSELKGMSGLKKLGIPFTTIFNPRTYKDIKRIIKKYAIEVVHVHNTLNLISPAVYYAAFSMNVPVVQTVHNFRLLCPGATFYRNDHICENCLEHGLLCAIKHQCYRKSMMQTLACVITMRFHRMMGIYRRLNYICLTDFNKEKLLNLRQVKENSIFVKPNFVFESSDVKSRANKGYFLFVGRIEKMKGIDILLQAWKQLENTQGRGCPQLITCGIGPLEEWCKEYISKNNLKTVKILGFVPNVEVRKMMSEAKAVILPTQCYEGFPMTIVEAYSVGTPVLGSEIGNTGNLIIDGLTGVRFNQNDINSIVQAVQWMAENKCDHVSEYYEQHYSEKENYKKLIHIYENVTVN